MNRSINRLRVHATHILLVATCAAPLAAHATSSDPALKVGDQQLQTRGILEASGQLKDVPYQIEWFNFPAAQPLARLALPEGGTTAL